MRLILNENFGTVVISKFRNFVSTKLTGGDNAVCTWSQPLLSFDIYKEILTIDEYEYLLSFFISTEGAKGTFLYQDPTDFQATITDRVTSGTAFTAGYLFPNPDGVNTVFNLAKVYWLSDNNYIFRPILHPIASTVVIGVDIPYSLDETTGRVVFSSPPPASGGIRWGGDFLVLVRFESDILPIKLITIDADYQYYRLEKLRLIEQKEESEMMGYFNTSLQNRPLLDIPLPFDSEIAPTYNTLVFEADSGFQFKKSTFDSPVKSYSLAPNKLLTLPEVQYLISFWRAMLGNALPFNMVEFDNSNRVLRFNQEELTITVMSEPDVNYQLYEISGLSFIEPRYGIDSVVFYCHLFELTRADGLVYRFTDFSDKLTIGGQVYSTGAGLNATATSAKLNEDRDNVEFASIVSDFITEEDLLSGAWNKALCQIKLYNWKTGEQRVVFAGYLGEVQVGFDHTGAYNFTYQSLGIQNKLAQKWSEKTSYLCRHTFGNLKAGSCRFDPSPLIRGSSIVAVNSSTNIIIGYSVPSGEIPYFAKYGYVKFLSGKNKGGKALIKEVSGTSITFWHTLLNLSAVGDLIELHPGCSKSVADCNTLYNNINNYGGFPLLPGYDILTTSK